MVINKLISVNCFTFFHSYFPTLAQLRPRPIRLVTCAWKVNLILTWYTQHSDMTPQRKG